MFSQNVLAESPASCSLSFPLCTSEEGTRRPQKHVFFSEVVREAQVHQRPGQEVSARWLRIIQSWQEAETSPDPNQTAAPERELSLGRQGHKSVLHGKEACSAFTRREHSWWGRGKGSQILKGTCSLSSEDGYFTRRCGTQEKCSWLSRWSSLSSEAQGPHRSPESSERQKRKGSHWAPSAVSKDFWIIGPCFNY